MTTELAVGLGFKILWASFAGFIAHIYWSIRRDKQKLDNTYTKDETDRAIEAKLEPTIQKVDNIHKMLEKVLEKIDYEKGTISNINTNLKVAVNDISHMKEDIQHLKSIKNQSQL